MNLDLTTQNYWCFQCQTSGCDISSTLTCSNCDSSAIEEITNFNDPRRHEVPIVQNNEEGEEGEEREEVFAEIFTQAFRVGVQMVRTLMNEPSENIWNSNGGQILNIQRLLTTMLEGGNDDTPATESQIRGLNSVTSVECSVCQEDEGEGVKLECNHSFHINCIIPWFQKKNTCPCCRKQLSS